MNRKEKALFNHVGQILKLYAEHGGNDQVGALVKFKYNLIVTFLEVKIFEWKFLEALSNYCIAKNVTWSISSPESFLSIKLSPTY